MEGYRENAQGLKRDPESDSNTVVLLIANPQQMSVEQNTQKEKSGLF